ncbi:hypothetical protein NP493_991g00096 [Ridgeia piscesae]|uniref:Selenocysteine lyase n=1 Tax=Ridgeia piscesae TaxID=27915 RepID=A0AAD9NJA7_RIDPI|nr:hypothetical protein NP493_991g00096 [Ridgeia piscesae]
MDSNATTPLDPEVLQVITSALETAWGNPSSNYETGVKAKVLINEARTHVATMVRCKPENIIFTSGGTESNNMVLYSALQMFWEQQNTQATGHTYLHRNSCSHRNVENENETEDRICMRPHFITTNIEHDSITKVLRHFQTEGLADVTYLPVSKMSGRVEAIQVLDALRPNTILVTVMLANNETGVIQPVGEIARKLSTYSRSKFHTKVFLHTDASQAIGKIPVDVHKLGVDFLTITGHKFYGPRIGALYVSNPDDLFPIFYGGGQERGYRPGTENTAMIAGLGKAAELVVLNIEQYQDQMRVVRDYLEDSLQKQFQLRVMINGRYPTSERLPNTCNVSFLGEGLQGNKVLARCRYFQASVGAACHSHMKYVCSQVLLASGVPPDVASNAIRLSIGRSTTKSDIDVIVNDLKAIVNLMLAEKVWPVKH